MDQQRRLHEILQELMAQRGLDARRLAELTNIQERYLEALLEGRYGDLPPAPYVHGYLGKLADVFGVSADDLARSYLDHEPAGLRMSGTHDRLPINRFALRRIGATKIVLIVVALGFVAYTGTRFNAIIGRPVVYMEAPASAAVVVHDPTFVIRGSINNPSDKLTINNEETITDALGAFRKEIVLQPGINTIHVAVARFLGRTTNDIRQVIYQPSETGNPVRSGAEAVPSFGF
ncbi:MAG: helix-turn-helix domain-containing protein [Candidatus Liptonbacteria bacterium]|nr:helix-turn-helix domain-containing protein [Candidatus Liptonbacteria bacterium]